MRRIRGFTVSEMMISIGVLGAVSASALGMTLAAYRDKRDSDAYVRDVETLRHASVRVEQDIRMADSVDAAAFVLVVGGEQVAYSLEGGVFTRRQGARSEVVGRRFESASISAMADGTYTGELALERRDPEAKGRASVRLTVAPRAEGPR